MAQLGAGFNGYARACETTGVGRGCRHRCNPAKVKSHANLAANGSSKAPRVTFVRTAFPRANLTRAFEDAMATHNSLLGGLYNHTATRGSLLLLLF